jgi:cystathionine beta-synthase
MDLNDSRWPGPVVDDVRQMMPGLVGSTPLVRLDVALRELGAVIDDEIEIWGKLEYTNPLGSIKDRPVLEMVQRARDRGELRYGMRVVEATSGNTGLALAGLCAAWGMSCTLVVPDKVSDEKIAALQALGAEVVVCPTQVAADDPQHYQVVADVLGREDGSWRPGQYENVDNPAAHRVTAGEILAQTNHGVTHVVAGVGTGGTLCGLASAFADLGASVAAVCADPVGSSLTGGDGTGWLIEGIGEDELPGNFDPSLVDDYVAVEDVDSVSWCRRLATGTGLWLGGSSGTAISAAVELAGRVSTGSVIVAVLADGGRAYLSKIYDDRWCAARGLGEGLRGEFWAPEADDSVGRTIHTGGFSVSDRAGDDGCWVESADGESFPRVASVRAVVVDGVRHDVVTCGVGERVEDVVDRGRHLVVCDHGRVVAVLDTSLVTVRTRPAHLAVEPTAR